MCKNEFSIFFHSVFVSLYYPSEFWSHHAFIFSQTKRNYVFSSALPLSSLLGNFSILNKNKFRSGVLRAFAGKVRSAAGATGHSRLFLSWRTKREQLPLRSVTSWSEWANLAPSPAYEFHGAAQSRFSTYCFSALWLHNMVTLRKDVS